MAGCCEFTRDLGAGAADGQAFGVLEGGGVCAADFKHVGGAEGSVVGVDAERVGSRGVGFDKCPHGAERVDIDWDAGTKRGSSVAVVIG